MDSKEVAEWPSITIHDSGTLTISRIQMGVISSSSIAQPAIVHISTPTSVSPPNYDHAVCDGFRISFSERSTGETYENYVGDTNVSNLCSGGISIGAEAFARLIHEKTEQVVVAHDKALVSWTLQLTHTLVCLVRLDLDRIIATKGTTEVLEVRLRSQATRITDLEVQVSYLKTSMEKVLDVLIAHTLGISKYTLIAELGLAGGKMSNKFVSLPCPSISGLSYIWGALPEPSSTNAVEILQSLFSVGFDPNTRNNAPYLQSGDNEYKEKEGKSVCRNETVLHYYAGRLKEWHAHNEIPSHTLIFTELLGHGADPKLVDNRGDNVLAWFKRSEKILVTRYAHEAATVGILKSMLSEIEKMLIRT